MSKYQEALNEVIYLNYYNDFYHFGKIIGEYQFATSSCYSKKEVNEMDKVIHLNIEQSLLNNVMEKGESE